MSYEEYVSTYRAGENTSMSSWMRRRALYRDPPIPKKDIKPSILKKKIVKIVKKKTDKIVKKKTDKIVKKMKAKKGKKTPEVKSWLVEREEALEAEIHRLIKKEKKYAKKVKKLKSQIKKVLRVVAKRDDKIFQLRDWYNTTKNFETHSLLFDDE
jgi:hypothetical protein